MSLFGAATSGVDPQTGSYLSKEQRVAMFRASRGQGGAGGGVGNNNRVSPQSSIVVVNKLNKISQTLENNFTSATQNVAEQVAQNRRDIENLYKIIATRQEQTLKREQSETKEARLAAGRRKSQLREKLIEGIAGATAAAAAASTKIAKAVSSPVMGFLQRLASALGYLAAAWFIRNLPTILDKLEGMFADFDGVKRELARQLLNQRGWAAGVDMFIRRAFRGVRNLARTVLRFTRWVGGRFIRLINKVYGTIADVLNRTFSFIFRKIGNLWKSFLDRAKKLIPKPLRNAWNAAKNSGAGKFIGNAARGTGKVIKGALSIGDSLLRGNYKEAGSKAFKGFSKGMRGMKNAAMGVFGKPIEKFAESKGIEKLTNVQRSAGLKKIFDPIIKALGVPFNVASKILKNVARLPVVGILVDVALNKAGGLGWVDSIINGLATGIAGAVGWQAGGMAGATVGTAIMPGPGTAIGGILGAIGGSMLAANLAENGVNAIRTATGNEAVVRPETSQETLNQLSTMIPGADFLRDSGSTVRDAGGGNAGGAPLPSLNLSGRFDNIPSTPDGMFTPGEGSSFSFDMIEMPPTTTKIPKQGGGDNEQPVEGPPALAASDSEMNVYKAMALQQYQIAY